MHRLLSTASFWAHRVQLPIHPRQVSTLRSWSDIGILDLQAFRQTFATKTDVLFNDSSFNINMAISKRAEFARNEIGLRAFKQYNTLPAEQTEIGVRSSQLHYEEFHRRFSLQWFKVFPNDAKPVVLVGVFPDQVKVWLWDKDVLQSSPRGRISLHGKVRASPEDFDRTPGHLLANIQYDDDEAWCRLGFENDFRTTLSQYRTKGELAYSETPFKGLATVTQHKLFDHISYRILNFFSDTRALNGRVISRSSKASISSSEKKKNTFEFHFLSILTDQADHILLLPYYPDRVEAFLCKKKEIINFVTENNRLFFRGSLDDKGQLKHVNLPGRLLASLPF